MGFLVGLLVLLSHLYLRRSRCFHRRCRKGLFRTQSLPASAPNLPRKSLSGHVLQPLAIAFGTVPRSWFGTGSGVKTLVAECFVK